jgi:hypothetical protein
VVLECSPYFVIDDLILLFMSLIDLLGVRMSSFGVYEDFGCLCLSYRT